MSNVFILIKYDILSFINKMKGNKKNSSTIALVLLFSFIIVSSSILIQTIYNLESLEESGYMHLSLNYPLMLSISFIGLLIITKSTLSKEKNTDFLLSLPIKRIDIILSKTITSVSSFFLISLLFTIPSFIYYGIITNNVLEVTINSIIVLILISLFFCGIGYLFNSFLNQFVIKFKCYKIIRLFFVLLLIFLFMGLNYSLKLNVTTLRIPIISTLIDIIISTTILEYLILFASSILSLTIGTLVFSKYYGVSASTSKNKNKELTFNTNSQLKTLVKKEFRNYFNSTMYLFQTIIGYILMIGGAIALIFINIDSPESIIYLFLCFSLSLTCTTNSSISLEGKNIWIIKSSPVDPKITLLSKALMNLIMLLITITVSFIIILFVNKIDLTTSILLYLLAILNSIFISFSGLFINLLLPKLDFKSEMEVVKQSASAVTSIFFFLIFLSLPSFLAVIGLISIDFNLLILINISYIAIMSIVVIILTFTKGVKLFERL